MSASDTAVVRNRPDAARSPVATLRRTVGHPVAVAVGQWALFVVMSALALKPVLTTAIVADDFYVLFYTEQLGGGSFVKALEIGMDGASLGHFNYLGQVIGAMTSWLWIQLSFVHDVRFSVVFAATKLVVYLAVASAAARFCRRALAAGGVSLSPWRTRIYVAVALFGSLQIHVPWSNDPTGSYPMAGFASAAIGFFVLSFAVDAYVEPSWRRSIGLGIAACAAVLYYEINVAVAIALVPVACMLAFRRDDEGRRSWRNVLLAGIPLGIPAFVTLVLRLTTQPEPGGFEYSGTTISTDATLIPSFLKALVSSLPGSAWKLSRDWLATPIWIRVTPVLLLVLFAVVLGVLAKLHPYPERARVSRPWLLASLVAAPLIYWVIATAIQSATPKVRSESLGIGYVYNYYAIGAVSVAVLVVITAVVIAPVVRHRGIVLAVLVPVVVAALSVQFLISSNVRARLAEVTEPNADLLTAYADHLPIDQRCDALIIWTNGAWPEYYERGVVDGLESASETYRDEPFCDEPIAPPG